jgi:hypothetical protein
MRTDLPKQPPWNRLPWWRKAYLCCSQPTISYSLIFGALGIAFLIGAHFLDADMAPIGLILIAVAIGMLLMYLILAYRAFGGDRSSSSQEPRGH